MNKIVNPICDGQDPFVLAYEGKYYHYSQSRDNNGFNVFISDDEAGLRDSITKSK